jgi:hypothetical protein
MGVGEAGGEGDGTDSEGVGVGVSGSSGEGLEVQPARLHKTTMAITALKHHWLLLTNAVNFNMGLKSTFPNCREWGIEN